MKYLTRPFLFVAAGLVLSSAANAQSSGPDFKDCDVCPDMMVVPAGEFLMGSTATFAGKRLPAEEQPQHAVTIQSFAIGKYEVTQEQWSAVMGDAPSANQGPTLPVERIAWVDIAVFVERLNTKTGKHYRLPTESEWEYAARAGTETLYSFGDDETKLGDFAWFGGMTGNSDGKTHPVGQKLPNPFGLYDMYGNVSEWVEDCYIEDYSNAPIDGSAASASNCERYVLRGGNWNNIPRSARSASRKRDFPGSRLDDLGFRLAKSLD